MEDRVESKNIVEIEKAKTVAPTSLFDFGTNLGKAWSFADTLSKSQIVPDTFRGNTASCLIALDMANRMRRNPLEVMQALYIVHGKPAFSSSFLIALINSCGYYEPLRFKFSGEGDARSCLAWTVDKRTGEKIEGPEVSIKMAQVEGWYGRNGSKWKTMPEVMLRYRAAAFFSRTYCPDLTGGFHTSEEIQETSETVATPSVKPPAQDLKAELMALSKPNQTNPSLPEPKESTPKTTTTDLSAKAEPVSKDPATVTNGALTEVERLQEQLSKLLSLNLTAEESEEWCVKHLKRGFKQLTKDDLKAAISKINAELDAREGVDSPKLF
jgi:hypothetical protein